MERRLAAILAFDMVGYSRLIGADEQGTLAAVRRHRSDIQATFPAPGCRITGGEGAINRED